MVARRDIFIKVFLLDFSISFIAKKITKKDNIHQTLLKKKAKVADFRRNPIQVNTCQENIHHNIDKFQELAINFGWVMYIHKSSHHIGIGRTIFIKFTDKINVKIMNKNSLVNKFNANTFSIFLLFKS